MSFVRTLATLAAGYAAAKGMEKYKQMGGMAGVQKSMQDNPQMQGATDQVSQMLEKMGVPGGAAGIQKMMDQWLGSTGQSGAAATAGLGGLLTAITGAAATGTENAGRMMDAFTGKTTASQAMEENAKLMIRAMIQAAKADGEIDLEEQQKILAQMGDIGPEERAFLEAEMRKPVDIMGLAQDTGDAMKAQVYAMSLMAIRVDTESEAAYLDGLARALGLGEDARAQVHRAMGLS
jgi:uncharacterized membrane protein YebE (DUF533 family)